MADTEDVVIRITAKNLTAAEFNKARKQLDDFGKKAGIAQGATGKLSSEINRGLNKALNQLGNQAGFATGALGKIGLVGGIAAAAIGTMTLAFNKLISESKRLTEESKKLGISTEQYQKQLGISIPLTEDAIEAGNRLANVWDNASTSVQNLGLNIAGVFTKNFAKKSPMLAALATGIAGPFGHLMAGSFDVPKPADWRIGAGGPQIPPQELARRNKASAEAERTQKALEDWTKALETSIPIVGEFSKWTAAAALMGQGSVGMLPGVSSGRFAGLTTAMPGMAAGGINPIGAVNPITGRGRVPIDVIAREMGFDPKVKDEAEEFGLSLSAAADIAIIFGDQLGSLGDALLQGSAAAAQWKNAGEGFAGVMDKAVAGVMGVMAVMNATSGGSTGSRVGGGALAGASLGTAILPGWGTAIGAAAGAITGLIRGSMGPDVGRDVGRDIGANISDELEKAIEESGENGQMFLREMFDADAIGLDRFAEEVGDLFSFFERGEISEKSLMGELKETLPILIENFDDLGASGQEQLERIIDAAQQAGIDLGIMGDELERLQAGIPEMTLEDFASTFGMSDEQKAKLQGLGLGIQTEAERAAQTLDIPMELLSQLGPQLEELGLSIEELPSFLEGAGINLEEFLGHLTLPPEVSAAFQQFFASQPTPENTGKAVADHLLPGFNAGLDRLGDKIIHGLRDALAQAS